MATYNGEKYIEEQLQSILDQTRPVDEVVICDDRSQDNTVQIVRKFIDVNNLTNWTYVVNEQNLGYIKNFRKAIDLINSKDETDKLIFLSDQDDHWVKDRVERMASEMEKHPEIGLLNTKQQTFRNGCEPWKDTSSANDIGEPKQIKLTPYTRFLRSLGCEMVFRKSFYDSVKQHWYCGWAHDEFLWSMAMLYNTCYEWDYISLYRRLHEKQVSGHLGHAKEKRIDYLQGVKRSSEHLLSLSEKEGLPESTQKLFRKNVKTHKLRLDMINQGKAISAFRLIPCLRYYYAPRSYFVELKMALKGKT